MIILLCVERFFDDNDDKQTAIETIVNIVINYKKAQLLGTIPKTKWSSIVETKQILKEEMSLEDKYFEDERIILKEGSKLLLIEIKSDFESFVGYKLNPQEMGLVLKKHGMKSTQSNGISYYKGWSFNKEKDQTTLAA